MPKVSVITTTHQRPQLLERAIKSVQAQTFKDWEHIIVYDGPPDKETVEVIKRLCQGEQYHFLVLPANHGNHTRPKNEGILGAKGDYICYLDDDNEYLPTFIENNLFELELSDADVVYSDMRLFQGGEDKGKGICFDFDPQLLLNRCFVDTGMVLHKRDAVYQVGGWDETLPRFADWNLWVRMSKAGLRFKHNPIYQTKYHITPKNSGERFPVKTWHDNVTGLTMFDPTWFSPSGCYIYLPYLGNDRIEETNPKVAIFTVTYDRLDYTKRMQASFVSSGIQGKKEEEYSPREWFWFDNGSKDGTPQWLSDKQEPTYDKWVDQDAHHYYLSRDNKGLTIGSNKCIDKILNSKPDDRLRGNRGGLTAKLLNQDFQLIIKVDNDCEFLTKGWLEDFIDLWKRNHRLYIGPYPEGLVDHPGGAPRVGHSTIGNEFVEVVDHLSGICAFVDARAYRNFRFKDQFLHGMQDAEASRAFIKQGYMPMILPRHRIRHMDGTSGQQEKYPEYFERRKTEKTTAYKRDYKEIQEQESAFSEGTVWGNRVKDSVQRYKDYFVGDIIDLGCNDGEAMKAMEKLFPNRKIFGIDVSPEKVERAKAKGLDARVGQMETSLSHLHGLNITVFCSHTLEHAEDITKAAAEISRVAKRLILIVPIEERTSNPGHTSPMTSPEYVKSLFPTAKILHEEELNRLEREYVLIADL